MKHAIQSSRTVFFGEAKVRFPRFPKMGYVFMAHVFCSGSVLCIKIAVL